MKFGLAPATLMIFIYTDPLFKVDEPPGQPAVYTWAASAQSLVLPIYPELTDEQISYVASKIKDFLAN